MIATLDRLMILSRKLRDAERSSERDPIYVALDLNEVHLLTRMLEDYLGEMDSFSASSFDASGSHSDDAY
jgi:hypothetical protein